MLKSVTSLSPKNTTLALAIASILALGAVGCSKTDSNNSGPHRAVIASPNTPLTAEQTVQFKKVLTSMGQVNALGAHLQESKKGKSPHPFSPIHQAMFQAFASFSQAGFPQSGTPTNQPIDPMQKRVESGDCTVNLTLPKDTPDKLGNDQTTIPTIGVEITGAACPMKYSVLVTGKQDPKTNAVDATMILKYDAITDEARHLNDVDHLIYTGHFLMSFPESGDKNSQTMTAITAINLDASGHSQSFGDFFGQNDITGTITAAGFKIDGTLQTRDVYQLPAFTGELTSKLDFTGSFMPKTEFKLNGQNISAEQFKAFRDQIKLPGMSTGGDSSTPTTGSNEPRLPLYCTITVEVPTVSGSVYPTSSSTCGQAKQESNFVMNHNITSLFSVQTGYMDAQVTICQNGSCDSMKRSFTPNQNNQTFSQHVLDSAVTMTCSFDAQCGQSSF